MVDTGQADVRSRIVHEPVGVCALITPWNYPLLQTSWKVAPALAAGNTFVLKPSELTPSTAILLMRYLERGRPARWGRQPRARRRARRGRAARRATRAVDLVSFTGGVQTGRHPDGHAAATVKKVALELGGKNPNIVFADADRDVALDFALTAVFLHSGQVCSAGARLRGGGLDQGRVRRRARRPRRADPARRPVRRARPRPAPLISAAHREKVEAYVAPGSRAGRDVLRCGGARPDDPSSGRRLLLPARRSSTTARATWTRVQDESFGPVLTVESFTDEDDAVAHRQRQHLRPGRRGLDRERRQGRAGRRPAPDGHGLDQRLPPVRPAGRVGRLQAVRASAASSGAPASRSTARPSTSGTTSGPQVQHWFGGA